MSETEELRATSGGQDDLYIDMEHLNIIFLDKEKLVETLKTKMQKTTQKYTCKQTFETTLKGLKLEMIDLMEKSVSLWKQLSLLNSAITEIKDKVLENSLFPRRRSSTLPVTALDLFELRETCSVTKWIEQSEFSSTKTNSTESFTTEITDCETRAKPIDDNFDEVCDSRTKETDISDDSSSTHNVFINEKEDKPINLVTSGIEMGPAKNMYNTLSETRITFKDDPSMISMLLCDVVLKNNQTIKPDLLNWSKLSCRKDFGSTGNLSDILSLSSKKGFNTRRKLHRQSRITDLSDYDHSHVVDENNLVNVNLDGSGFEINHDSLKDHISHSTLNHTECENAFSSTDNSHSSDKQRDDIKKHYQDTTETNPGAIEHNTSETEVENANCICDSEKEHIEALEKTKDANIDQEIESFEFNNLVFRDGIVSCRILTPSLEEEIQRNPRRNSESEEFEFLKIKDGRITFAPIVYFERESNWLDPFSEDDTYSLDVLFSGRYDDRLVQDNSDEINNNVCKIQTQNEDDVSDIESTEIDTLSRELSFGATDLSKQALLHAFCNRPTLSFKNIINDTFSEQIKPGLARKMTKLEIYNVGDNMRIDASYLEKLMTNSRDSSLDSGFGDDDLSKSVDDNDY